MTLLFALCVGMVRADTPVMDLWKSTGPGGGTMANVTSMWGPSLVVTRDNTTIAFSECDRSPSSHNPWMAYRCLQNNGAVMLLRCQ